MFKFELNQVVFYMLDNKVHSAPITSRTVVENAHDDWACTKEQKESWQPYGPSTVKYGTTHSTDLNESEVFESREALLLNYSA